MATQTATRVRVNDKTSHEVLGRLENSMKSTNVTWFKSYLASRLKTTRSRHFDRTEFVSRTYTRAELAHLCRIVGLANPTFGFVGVSKAPYMHVVMPNGQDLCVWLK